MYNILQPVKESFDADPFAALHAPTGQGQVLSPNTQTQSQNISSTTKSGPPPRPESPSPALPPKKSKVPPPRPAPPRPLQVFFHTILAISILKMRYFVNLCFMEKHKSKYLVLRIF